MTTFTDLILQCLECDAHAQSEIEDAYVERLEAIEAEVNSAEVIPYTLEHISIKRGKASSHKLTNVRFNLKKFLRTLAGLPISKPYIVGLYFFFDDMRQAMNVELTELAVEILFTIIQIAPRSLSVTEDELLKTMAGATQSNYTDMLNEREGQIMSELIQLEKLGCIERNGSRLLVIEEMSFRD